MFPSQHTRCKFMRFLPFPIICRVLLFWFHDLLFQLRTLSVFQPEQAMYEIGSVIVGIVDCLAFQRAGIGSVKWCWDCFYVLPVNRFRSDLMKTCDHLNVFVKRINSRLILFHSLLFALTCICTV